MNKRRKKVKILWDRVLIAVVLLLIIILLISAGISKIIHKGSDKKSVDSNTSEVTSIPEESTEPDNTINANYDFLEVPNEDVHKGNLVLINNDHQFTEGTAENLVKITDKKSGDYKVAYSDSMLNEDVILKLNDMVKAFAENTSIYDLMLAHTYRTIDEQQKIYDDAVDNEKDLMSSQYVKPNCTELHTGLALDFGIFPHDDKNFIYDGTGEYSWLEKNAPFYGFILRYPEGKEESTGVKYDISHYRYVGVPHSALISQQKLSLEEYLNEIKENKFKQNPMTVSSEGNWAYTIYFIPLGENGTTNIPVPKGTEYTISGNNYDGFIVTIKTE